MLLTIDAGNTRTKWAVFNRNGEIIQHGACFNDALAGADFSPQLLGYDRVVISNVAGKAHAEKLENKLKPYEIPARWITASLQAGNVINGYTEPETLGSDRWTALIAAWHLQHAACVVVNAGTAITIDALMNSAGNKAEFLGGMILPGLNLMQASLGIATAQLPKHNAIHNFAADSPQVAVDIFAKSTAQAIHAGALNAVCGAIIRMADTLAQNCAQTPFIILSGGNAAIIQNNLAGTMAKQTVIIDNLVLTGLYLLDCSNQQLPQSIK